MTRCQKNNFGNKEGVVYYDCVTSERTILSLWLHLKQEPYEFSLLFYEAPVLIVLVSVLLL